MSLGSLKVVIRMSRSAARIKLIYMTLIAAVQMRLGEGVAADVAPDSSRRTMIRADDKLLTFERLTADKPAICK
jgi:hypothetical protein